MKKLLSLLSTMTIASSGIAGIVANSPYEKQEQQTKLKNINYKRQKRSNNENNKINRTKIVIKTEGNVRSSGVVFKDKLYFGSFDKNVYEYDPTTNTKKVIIRTNGEINSSGVVLNNKIYFGSFDKNVYEYDPVTEQQKIVIKTNNWVWSSGVTLNNKLYFGSEDHNVYEYDPATEQQKVVIRTKDYVFSSGVVFNNKLYFGSFDKNVYEYDPVTGQQKTVIKTNGEINSSGVVLNNKVYFGSWDHNVYEYDPATQQQKIIITAEDIINYLAISLNNKLYVGSDDGNVYEYDPVTGQQKIIITTGKIIRTIGYVTDGGKFFPPEGKWGEIKISPQTITKDGPYGGSVLERKVDSIRTYSINFSALLNNKLYVSTFGGNVYEYDPATEQQKVVIRTKDYVFSSGVVFKDKLYFGSNDNNVYEYDPTTNTKKVIIRTNGEINSSGVVLNNKIYFGSEDGNVYEYDFFSNINDVIEITNLNVYNDNKKTILNELNYLNPELDISQLEVTNITNTSATIKTKNNSDKYFGEKTFYYNLNNEQNKVINLNELIKRAIFFKFQDKYPILFFKEIKDINTNNLSFGNVEITRDSKLLHSVNFKNASCFENKTYNNKSSLSKIIVIPACEENSKSKLVFQITTGLSKNGQGQTNKENGWNINFDDEVKLTDFTNINNNKDSEIINELSNNFDLSNINKQEQEMILHSFNKKTEFEAEINPQEQAMVKYSVRETNLETLLNLKQKIGGTIPAKIIDDNNEEQIITLSIKEAMEILQKYSLLPSEITINEDNSITFNGKGKISLTQEAEPKLIVNTSIV